MLNKNSDTVTRSRQKARGKFRTFLDRLFAFIFTIIVLALVIGGLFYWREMRSGSPAYGPQSALPVAATIVDPQTLPVSLDAVGTVRAVREVTLAPEIGGRVSAIAFDAGAKIEENTLLVQLYDGPERADRDAAKARAALAEAQLARSEELAPTGAESRALLDQRRAERDQALAAVEQLDARIMQKQIRAPFSGEIGIRRINLGEIVSAGDAIATLTALDAVFVEFSLPQQELSRVRPGAIVRIVSDAWPDRIFEAQVNAIEPWIGEDTRNVRVQAAMSNEDGALRPGMYVTASLSLPPQEGALAVPTTAIQTSAQGDSVIAIRGENASKEGVAEIVPIVAGRRIGDDVVIASGLKPGDVVVTGGQLRVQPGAYVTVTRLVTAGGK